MSRIARQLFVGLCAVLALLPADAVACSVCFGAVESPMMDGLQFSMIAMLVLVYTVIIGLIVFFFIARRKASSEQPPTDQRNLT